MSSRRSSSFMVLGLIARSDFPCVEMSERTPDRESKRETFHRRWEHTPVILLLLVVVAELSFTLRSHASFRLQHLLGFVRSWLMSLIGVETLQIGARLRAKLFIVTYRVSLRHTTHARVWKSFVKIFTVRPNRCWFLTEVGERSRTSHRRQGVSP